MTVTRLIFFFDNGTCYIPYSSTSGTYSYIIIGYQAILNVSGMSGTSTSSTYFTLTGFDSTLVPTNTQVGLLQVVISDSGQVGL